MHRRKQFAKQLRSWAESQRTALKSLPSATKFPPASLSPKFFNTFTKLNRREAMRTSDEIHLYSLAAPLSTTQFSTPNDEPKAEPTAKRGKALRSTCPSSLHHNSPHADLSQPATLRFALFTKQARRPPLPPLQICRIGFRATHGNSASVPSKQGPAGSSSQALSLSPGQPWLQERSTLSPFSHICLLTAAAVQEKSDTTGQRDRCSTRLKWGEAPTKASSTLRLPQEKLRKKFFSDARKP